jgi:hypothetical protein
MLRKELLMRRLWLAVVLMLILSVVPGALAKPLVEKLTISGPGIHGEFTATRADIVQGLANWLFVGFHDEIEPPADPGEGYILKLYYHAAGDYHVHELVSYYPGAVDGRDVIRIGGYIHFTTEVQGDRIAMRDGVHVGGHWYYANPKAEKGFARLLAHARTQSSLLRMSDSIRQLADPETLKTIGGMIRLVSSRTLLVFFGWPD